MVLSLEEKCGRVPPTLGAGTRRIGVDLSRRELLAAFGTAAVAAAAPTNFSFIHFTDLHIQPERRAAAGCAQCVARMNRLNVDFAVCGGDLVFDAAEVGLV